MLYKELDIELDYSRLNCEKTDYQPKLQIYVPNTADELDKYMPKRPSILMCPGGSYVRTSEREVEPLALYFLAKGYNCFVLRYSCDPARFPVQLAEAGKALLTIKENAEKWKVDLDRIYVLGCSAGGHLAASLGVFWNKPFLAEILNTESEKLRFNSLILSYPVISCIVEQTHLSSFRHLLGKGFNDKELVKYVSLETEVSPDTPRTFIWHTYEDTVVPIENSLAFAYALFKNKVPLELHIYEHGAHGQSTGTKTCCTKEQRLKEWLDTCYGWLEENAILDSAKAENE